MKLSVIMACYNEKDTILKILDKVKKVDIDKEVIIVDDGSTSQTRQLLENLSEPSVKVIFHEKNKGKGGAIRSALKQAQGDIVLIQDADLEYDPVDYPNLIEPIISGKADVVYGSRFTGTGPRKVFSFFHYVCNKGLTLFSNILSNLNLTDMETGYKVFKRDVIKGISLKENRFGFEPEVTMKLARQKAVFYEVGISYYGRDYSQGKKIKWVDGIHAVWCLFRYKFFN